MSATHTCPLRDTAQLGHRAKETASRAYLDRCQSSERSNISHRECKVFVGVFSGHGLLLQEGANQNHTTRIPHISMLALQHTQAKNVQTDIMKGTSGGLPSRGPRRNCICSLAAWFVAMEPGAMEPSADVWTAIVAMEYRFSATLIALQFEFRMDETLVATVIAVQDQFRMEQQNFCQTLMLESIIFSQGGVSSRPSRRNCTCSHTACFVAVDADAMRPSADLWTTIRAMQPRAMQQSFSATLDVLQYRFQMNYLSATVLNTLQWQFYMEFHYLWQTLELDPVVVAAGCASTATPDARGTLVSAQIINLSNTLELRTEIDPEGCESTEIGEPHGVVESAEPPNLELRLRSAEGRQSPWKGGSRWPNLHLDAKGAIIQAQDGCVCASLLPWRPIKRGESQRPPLPHLILSVHLGAGVDINSWAELPDVAMGSQAP